MTSFQKPKILVTVELPGFDDIALPLIIAFNNLHVILLGYNRVPEQTSPEQARDKYGEEAQNNLDKMAGQLETQAVRVDTRLVFTGNVADSVKRIVEEEEIDAVLEMRPLAQIKSIFVPLHSDQQQPKHVAAFVAALVRDSEINVNLRLLRDPEEETQKADALLHQQRQAFERENIAVDLIETEQIETAESIETIIEMANSGDVMILGEADPSMRERIFGTVHEQIAPHVDCPVVLVLLKEN